jgi:phosphonate metabolism-associated iron-containing alcohol dehydrogenase
MAASAIHLKWFNPVHIEWGEGLLKTFESDTPFLVLADPGAIALSMEMDLQQVWGPRCLHWIWQRAPQSSVGAAYDLCQKLWPLWEANPHAALLAIGGGTTLDLAKIARFRLPDLNDASRAWRGNRLPADHLRQTLWCAPTTSGTGSEVTPWATLWDLDMTPPLKRSWSSPLGFPDHALIDPTLTLRCPESLTRNTALDTLAHALESLWNRNANELTRPLAIQAAQIVLASLPSVLQRPQDMGLRSLLSKASLLAGLAMSQTQTALAHALSYELTLQENLPHGHACAVWLPMVMALACERDVRVRQDLAQVFGSDWPQAIDQLTTWLQALDISPRDLRHTPAGREELLKALSSARGRNFIGSSI